MWSTAIRSDHAHARSVTNVKLHPHKRTHTALNRDSGMKGSNYQHS